MKRLNKIKLWMGIAIAFAWINGVIYYYYNSSEIYVYGVLIGIVGLIGIQYELEQLNKKSKEGENKWQQKKS